MSHVFAVSDEDYAAIEEVAKRNGRGPEELFHEWVTQLRRLAESEQGDLDQAWFWTPQWQAKEREADAAIAAGDGEFFDSSEAFLASLDQD